MKISIDFKVRVQCNGSEAEHESHVVVDDVDVKGGALSEFLDALIHRAASEIEKLR